MPRKRAVTTATPPESRKRRRRSKADQAEPIQLDEPVPALPTERPPHDPALAEAERQLAAKYPHVQVVPGSLRPGAAEGWGTKRIVDLTCVDCGTRRTVATSDVFHSNGRCLSCSKAAKKAARKMDQ